MNLASVTTAGIAKARIHLIYESTAAALPLLDPLACCLLSFALPNAGNKVRALNEGVKHASKHVGLMSPYEFLNSSPVYVYSCGPQLDQLTAYPAQKVV